MADSYFEKQGNLRFPESVPDKESRPGQWFIYRLHELFDALSSALSLRTFRSTAGSKTSARICVDNDIRDTVEIFTTIADYIGAFRPVAASSDIAKGRL